MKNPFRKKKAFTPVRPDYIKWDGDRKGPGKGWYWRSGLWEPAYGSVGKITGYDPTMYPRVGDLVFTNGEEGTIDWWVIDSVSPYEDIKEDPNKMFALSVTNIGSEKPGFLDIAFPASTYVESADSDS